MLSPHKSPVKFVFEVSFSESSLHNRRIPLNDDRAEKAKRFRSKQVLQEMQMNQIIAAASPVRKRISMGARMSGSPGTPGQDDKENDGMGLSVVGGSAVTPMKRVPILANFEEWMKMATDNVRLGCRGLTAFADEYRKSTRQTHGTSHSLTISTTCRS